MNEIIYSFQIIVPFFLLGAFGYLVKYLGIIDEDFINKGLTLSFNFIFPIMVFKKIYTANIVSGFNAEVFIFGLIVYISMIVLGIVVAAIYSNDNFKRGSIACGIFKSNFVVIGMPIIESMYGPEASVNFAALTPFLIPVYNVASVIAYTIFSPSPSQKKLSVKEILLTIMKNPFIISVAAASFIRLLHIRIPGIFVKCVSDLSSMATPFALILVGGMLELNDVKHNLRDSITTCLFRLILFPLAAVCIAIYMGFRNEALMTILLLTGAPTAVSNAAFAKNMKGDHKLAGEITMLSMFLFTFTIFLFILVLKFVHLI